MNSTNPENDLCGISVNELHPTLMILGKMGVNQQHFTKLRSNLDFAERVAKFICNGGFNSNTNQKRAREIMGKNFFGIEEAIKYFGVNPSEEQLKTLSEISFSEDVLRELKDTHILVAVFPISILEIRERAERNLFYSHENSWYNDQSFAREKGTISWELVKKTPVPNSTSKSWKEQQKLLQDNEQVPSAQIMVYTIIGHYLATKERLFENIYVRTSSLDSGGHRVDVCNFDSDGLRVGDYWDGGRLDALALASSQKS